MIAPPSLLSSFVVDNGVATQNGISWPASQNTSALSRGKKVDQGFHVLGSIKQEQPLPANDPLIQIFPCAPQTLSGNCYNDSHCTKEQIVAKDTLIIPSKNMLFESDEARILAISFQRLPFLTSLRRKSTDDFYWNRSVFSSQQI